MFTIGTQKFKDAQELLDYLAAGYGFPDECFDHKAILHPIESLMAEGAGDLAHGIFQRSKQVLDLYEYDSFLSTIYSAFDYNTPATEKNLGFFWYLVSNTQNINEEVSNKTLLEYYLDRGLPVEFFYLLLEAGCDVNYRSSTGRTYLHNIIDIYWHIISDDTKMAWFLMLIDAGIDINQKNNEGETALIYAVKNCAYQYIKTLLDHDADPNQTDDYKCSAFYYTMAHGERNLAFDLMMQYASPDFDMLNRYGETSFIAFMKRFSGSEEDMKLLPKLIEAGADFSQTITGPHGDNISAISLLARKKTEVLKFVLEQKFIDVHQKDNNGDTILHMVCASYTGWDSETAKEVYRKVKLLLQEGADPDSLNDRDETPMMLAVLDDAKAKTVELLLAAR
ncbi:ankyrin repeat domain-containing protein [Flavobacterium chilense]|uniref:Ankyrin repeat-containing protein n=1 Tax=Flavobacterium chilense TaxID=946677 RepID=A0A1M7F1H4_9FLAO|nr:ankyrin repeat domain-containing protein [Flavobacterium chilense]SHL97567.1 Ankyrin repeat-containing protein [Flavobacterium chilense]